jgi:hypothetical protein
MAWWIWLLAGFGLLLVEAVTPGVFFFMFFGIGALLVGILVELGVLRGMVVEFLVFSVFSIASLLVFRRPLMQWLERRNRSGHEVDSIAGETAVLTEDLAPNGIGKAELRGTSWAAHNATATAMTKGQRCRVQRVDGLKLIVAPE